MRQWSIILWGVFFCIGLYVQIHSSISWYTLSEEKIGASETTIREAVFMLGQSFGETIYIIICRYAFIKFRDFKLNENKWYERLLNFFVIVAEGAVGLIIVDAVSILFLDPFAPSMPKNRGVMTALLIIIFRGYKYFRRNG